MERPNRKHRLIEAEAFPLYWPEGVPRRKRRDRAKFVTTMAKATGDVRHQVELLGGRYLTISTNVPIRQDGLPYAGKMNPSDPGVAVYFLLKDRPHCMPCDRWDRVQDNLRAIAKHVEALRGIARWGVQSVEQAFAGFAALPAPGADWRAVLGLWDAVTAEEVEARFRELLKVTHPDVGGSHDEMVRLEAARRCALEALR